MSILVSRGRGFSEKQRVEAPSSGAVKDHEEKHPAKKHGKLAMIGKLFSGARDREKFCHRRRSACDVHREVGIRKHAAANERRETGKQPKSDHEAADKLDPTAQLTLQIIGAGHSAEHSENQLPTMLGKE